MSIPQPVDNDKFKFVPRNKQVETSNKVVELRQQKQESTAYYVSCLLAAEALDYWLKPKKYPLSHKQVLRLLGVKIEAKELDDDGGELELVKFLENHLGKQKTKKYRSLANYREEINLLDEIKKANSTKVGSLHNELRIRIEDSCQKYSVKIDVVEEVAWYFDFMENYLDTWYFTDSRDVGFISCKNGLKDNSLRLKNQLHTRLEDVIAYGHGISLKGSLIFLAKLSTIFQELEQEYAKERARRIEKENACWRTYNRSLSVLKDSEDEDSNTELEQLLYGIGKMFKPKEFPCSQELMESFRIAKNNLLNLYTHKIEAEAYSQAIQVITKLEAINEVYIERLKSSEKFLREMRDGFLAEIKMAKSKIMLTFILEDVSNHVNLELLLQSVEEKVASPLWIWGSHRRVNQEMVRASLLSELDPLAQKICSSTKEQLNQEYQ